MALRVDHTIEELLRRRVDRQAADVNDAAGTDDETVRILEVNIPADRPALIGVEGAVDDGLAVTHKVDQIAGAVGDVEVRGVATGELELRERVERIAAADRGGRDAGRTATDLDLGLGAAIGNDVIGLRLGERSR